MAQSKRISTVGGWKLDRQIDAGGNGDVWLASKPGQADVAIKILRRIDSLSYQRFRAEVKVLKANNDITGIVPLLDHYLPADETKEVTWYAMPLAIGCAQFLKGKPAAEVVREFVKLAETIAILHSRAIAHRDIKPQNILALGGRLCLSDFGLVKYPEREPLTPAKRDVGPKFTMAPEMRRFASQADGAPADVFSFAKTLWIALTGKPLGFDGQYNVTSDISLKACSVEIYTTTLDQLLVECTHNDPSKRPKITEVAERLREWLTIVDDFDRRNGNEWTEVLQLLFPIGVPSQAAWVDLDSILLILGEVGKVRALNHMFYPDGGGNTITEVSRAGEEGFIAIQAMGVSILRPAKLTFESFGAGPEWNYLRLEAAEVDPTEADAVSRDGYREYLTELEPGYYGSMNLWHYAEDYDEKLPENARPVVRYLKGSFVIFSTSSPYNQDTATYDARHEKMNEDTFRDYMRRNALRDGGENE